MFRPILLLLALVATGVGQTPIEPPRVRHVQVGIGGQFRNRHWTPVAVDVENPGPARTGQLVMELDGHFSGQRLEFIRPVMLPANSFRRFEFTIFPDARNPVGAKQALERVVQVKLTDGGLQVWSRNEGLGHKVAEDGVAVPKEERDKRVECIAPHALTVDSKGDLHVVEWVPQGRVRKFRHTPMA